MAHLFIPRNRPRACALRRYGVTDSGFKFAAQTNLIYCRFSVLRSACVGFIFGNYLSV
ncbi:MAG: hypothetical protein P8X74_14750 [Reinekea sp.]